MPYIRTTIVKIAIIPVLISLFIFFTSPTATHAVANAARVMGLKPMLVPDKDLENAEDR